ncbi:cellulose-binding protein [Streptomyces sp. O3]
MGAPSSPHGFDVVRRRGYRTDQADAYVSGLCRERDAAWERAARLTVLAKEMSAEAERLRAVVAELAPQTYETLGPRAQAILAASEEEADAVRGAARGDAERWAEDAAGYERALVDEARAAADAVRAAAEERARQVLAEARSRADEERLAARRSVKAVRAEAAAVLREMRQRTEGMLRDLGKEQAERWDEAGRAEAEREAGQEELHARLTAAAEAGLAEAGRAFAEAEESARHGQEDAEARGAELVAAAGARVERIERETERVLREHEAVAEELRSRMDHVRTSLTALTGRAPAEDTP